MLKQKGFTLIELLVALAVFSTLAVMIYQTLSQLGRQSQVLQQHQEANQAWQNLWFWLAEDLTQAMPRGSRDEQGDVQAALLTQADGVVSWVRRSTGPLPGSLQMRPLVRVGYALVDHEIHRLVWPLVDRAQDTQAIAMPLQGKISQMQWRFLDAYNQWHDSWPPANQSADTNLLPQVVELTLETQEQGHLMWRFPLIKTARPAS